MKFGAPTIIKRDVVQQFPLLTVRRVIGLKCVQQSSSSATWATSRKTEIWKNSRNSLKRYVAETEPEVQRYLH